MSKGRVCYMQVKPLHTVDSRRNVYNMLRYNAVLFSELCNLLGGEDIRLLGHDGHSEIKTPRKGSDLDLISESYDHTYQPLQDGEHCEYLFMGNINGYFYKDFVYFQALLKNLLDNLDGINSILYVDSDLELDKSLGTSGGDASKSFMMWLSGKAKVEIEGYSEEEVEKLIHTVRSKLKVVITNSGIYSDEHLSNLGWINPVVVPTMIYRHYPDQLKLEWKEKIFDFMLMKYPASWVQPILNMEKKIKIKYFLNLGLSRRNVALLRDDDQEIRSMPIGEQIPNIAKEVSECWVHTSVSGIEGQKFDWLTFKLLEAYYGRSMLILPSLYPLTIKLLEGCSPQSQDLIYDSSELCNAEDILSGVESYLSNTTEMDRLRDIERFNANIDKHLSPSNHLIEEKLLEVVSLMMES